jgi:hypothetical protein
MKYTEITRAEMREVLQPEKGWEENQSGYEYVYDHYVPDTDILIKVLSSVSVNDNKGRRKGKDAIRVYSVVVRGREVVRGLTKPKRVFRVEGWRENLEKAFIEIGNLSKKRRGIKSRYVQKKKTS